MLFCEMSAPGAGVPPSPTGADSLLEAGWPGTEINTPTKSRFAYSADASKSAPTWRRLLSTYFKKLKPDWKKCVRLS